MKYSLRMFQDFLAKILAPFDSAVIINREGEVLDLKYETLADVGTLATAAQTCCKYFPLNDGDLVLLNDPYSGGTVLSSMTLVTSLDPAREYFIAVRTGFRPQISLGSKLDEEGLRIPPTPIAQKRILNEPIIEAILSHPHCPDIFKTRLMDVSKSLWFQIDGCRSLMKKDPDILSKNNVRNYLNQSKVLALSLMSEGATGEVTLEDRLETGEVIRLKSEVSHQSVHFDFSGSGPAKKVSLTDLATLGACFGAWTASFNMSLPINSGVLSLLQVTAPLGCFLNSKYPSPTFRGMTEGTAQIAQMILRSFEKLKTKPSTSGSAQTPLQISLEFEGGLRFFEALPGGVGATSTADGADALPFWVRNRLKNSIQEIEQRFPLQFLHVGRRNGSGGKGQFKGGAGMSKEIELQQPARLKWLMEQIKSPPKGQQGGQDGDGPKILVVLPDGVKHDINQADGEMKLAKGTRITYQSGGGAGFGSALT